MKRYCDIMAFLGFQGQPPVVHPWVRDNMSLMHLTSAPPIPICGASIVTMANTMVAHRQFKKSLEEQGVPIIRRGDEINDNRFQVVLGLQNAPDDLTVQSLHDLFDAGVSIMGLAYQGENRFAGGFASDGRLTDDGRKIIMEMAKIGMILDLSHLNHLTAQDVIEFVSDDNEDISIIASHGGCYEQYGHRRNLTEQIIADITQLGGLVGIYTMTFGLHESDNSLGSFLEHFQRIMDIPDVDCSKICIGSDGYYHDVSSKGYRAHVDKMIAVLDGDRSFGARFPDHPLALNCVDRMSIIDHILRDIRRSDDEVDGVLSSNALNWFSKKLP